MKLLKIMLNCLILLGGLLGGISLNAMQSTPAALQEPKKAVWYTESMNLGISNPLRIRTVNKTGARVATVQQGQSKDYWHATMPNGNSFEDTRFNMDAWTKEHPQYFFITDKSLYILNFEKEKNATWYKAIFEKLAIRLKPNSINYITVNDLIKLNQITDSDPAFQKIIYHPIEKGDTLIINLNEDSASLDLTYD